MEPRPGLGLDIKEVDDVADLHPGKALSAIGTWAVGTPNNRKQHIMKKGVSRVGLLINRFHITVHRRNLVQLGALAPIRE